MNGVFVPLPPSLRRHLLWTLRLRDACTGAVITTPFTVTVPEFRLTAVPGPGDGTWRLVVDDHQQPGAGPDMTVVISDALGAYRADAPVLVPRVHPGIAHPPPPVRADFLIDVALWPTRRLPIPAGETAVVGRLVDALGQPLPGRRVAIAPGTVLSTTPAAPTDAAGEFVLRLPTVRRPTPDQITADLAVAVSHGGAPVALATVAPAGGGSTARLDIGLVTLVTLTAA